MSESDLVMENSIKTTEYGISDIDKMPIFSFALDKNEQAKETKLAKHKAWLKSIRHETPNPSHPYRIGVYIRYFNQTKYENYLEYHIKQYQDTISNCPLWTIVDFYIDEGSTAPYMENAPELRRLLDDCFDGKVDLIITQKVSNVSRKPEEVTFVSRILATQEHPVGIYFISENIFTLATYYLDDMQDIDFRFNNNVDGISGETAGGMLHE